MSAELSSEDRQLLERIVKALKEKAQFIAHFSEGDQAGIEKVRSLGRQAGRQLGWKVRTIVGDPNAREDRHVVVGIVVMESSPLHQELMEVRFRDRR